MNTIKSIVAAAALAVSFSSFAESTFISGYLGGGVSGASASDVYLATCPEGMAILGAKVKDNAPIKNARVLVQIAQTNMKNSLQEFDAVDADAGFSKWTWGNVYSPYWFVTPFNSYIYVTKSAAAGAANVGYESYTLEAECVHAFQGQRAFMGLAHMSQPAILRLVINK